jgi:hypothetical protein
MSKRVTVRINVVWDGEGICHGLTNAAAYLLAAFIFIIRLINAIGFITAKTFNVTGFSLHKLARAVLILEILLIMLGFVVAGYLAVFYGTAP